MRLLDLFGNNILDSVALPGYPRVGMTSALELAAALHARVLAMLEACIDDSENDRARPHRIFVVAGWCGDKDAWNEVDGQWQAALSRFGIPEFHSADLLGGYGIYDGIPKDTRESLRWELIQAIICGRLFGAATNITLDESRGRIKKRSEYQFCLAQCMESLATSARKVIYNDRIAFMVDEQQKHLAELNEATKQLRRHPTLGHLVGPSSFYTRKQVWGIQVADLLAHESYLQRLNEIEGRPPRREFLALRHHIVRNVLHWDQEYQPVDLTSPPPPRGPSFIRHLLRNLRFGNRD